MDTWAVISLACGLPDPSSTALGKLRRAAISEFTASVHLRGTHLRAAIPSLLAMCGAPARRLPSRIEHQPSNGYLLPAALVTVKTADCIDARFGVHSALLPFTAPPVWTSVPCQFLPWAFMPCCSIGGLMGRTA